MFTRPTDCPLVWGSLMLRFLANVYANIVRFPLAVWQESKFAKCVQSWLSAAKCDMGQLVKPFT